MLARGLQGTLRLKEGEVEGDEEAPRMHVEAAAAARRRSMHAMRGGGWDSSRRGSGSGTDSDNSGLAPLGGTIVPSVTLPQRRPMMPTPFEVLRRPLQLKVRKFDHSFSINKHLTCNSQRRAMHPRLLLMFT